MCKRNLKAIPFSALDYNELAASCEKKDKEIERLENKYEKPGQECNSGHKNTLPMSLWDCPMCTDERRKEIKRLGKALDDVLTETLGTNEDVGKDNLNNSIDEIIRIVQQAQKEK